MPNNHKNGFFDHFGPMACLGLALLLASPTGWTDKGEAAAVGQSVDSAATTYADTDQQIGLWADVGYQ
jgi:hypothetical protein